MKINKLFNMYKTPTGLERTNGVVISYDIDTGYAVVRLPQYNNAERKFLNKTGELLSEGDAVWLYYWGNINAAYVALRNGKPAPLGGGGLQIDQAAVVVQSQADLYGISGEVIAVDLASHTKVIQGDPRNFMIGGGLPFVLCANSKTAVAEFLQSGISDMLLLSSFTAGGTEYEVHINSITYQKSSDKFRWIWQINSMSTASLDLSVSQSLTDYGILLACYEYSLTAKTAKVGMYVCAKIDGDWTVITNYPSTVTLTLSDAEIMYNQGTTKIIEVGA